MVIGTALDWNNPATTASAIMLAFFGYALTTCAVLEAGLRPAPAVTTLLPVIAPKSPPS